MIKGNLLNLNNMTNSRLVVTSFIYAWNEQSGPVNIMPGNKISLSKADLVKIKGGGFTRSGMSY